MKIYNNSRYIKTIKKQSGPAECAKRWNTAGPLRALAVLDPQLVMLICYLLGRGGATRIPPGRTFPLFSAALGGPKGALLGSKAPRKAFKNVSKICLHFWRPFGSQIGVPKRPKCCQIGPKIHQKGGPTFASPFLRVFWVVLVGLIGARPQIRSLFTALQRGRPFLRSLKKYPKWLLKSMENYSQNRPDIINKSLKNVAGEQYKKKTQQWLPLGSFWAPVWHARRALALTWGALWPPLHIQIWPLLPSVRSFAPQTPKRHQNNTKMSPKWIQNGAKM